MKRVAQHIHQFIRLQVEIGQKKLSLVVDKTQTIEYLARYIEAEYAIRFAIEEDIDCFVISQLYTAGSLSLPFKSIISDELEFDDEIVAVSAQASQKTVETEDSLESTMNNLIALQFLLEFCIKEFSVENVLFWVECQILKSIQSTQHRSLFTRYLYNVYIRDNAPLSINIAEDVRKDINIETENCYQEAQALIFSMLQGHVFPRFQTSEIFHKFTDYRNSDRYAFIQATVDWSQDVWYVEEDRWIIIADMVEIIENPGSDEAEMALKEFTNNKATSFDSRLFKQKLLRDIMSRYFPLVSPVHGYFSKEIRIKWSEKQKKVFKQKILTKFFGTRLTEEQMMSQPIANMMYSQSMTSMDSISETDKLRKKINKLHEFFGDIVTKSQLLLDETPQKEEEDKMQVGNYRMLDPEVRKKLAKKAQKLKAVFGEDPSLALVAQNLLSKSDESVNVEEEEQDVQKTRLAKLSQFLGHRVNESDLITGPAGHVARPLTTDEKKAFLKKSSKLEKLLGSTIPAENLLHSTAITSVVNVEDLEEIVNIADDEEDKRQKLQRFNKLRKILGMDSEAAKVIQEQFLDDLAKSQSDPELKEDLNKLSSIVKQKSKKGKSS